MSRPPITERQVRIVKRHRRKIVRKYSKKTGKRYFYDYQKHRFTSKKAWEEYQKKNIIEFDFADIHTTDYAADILGGDDLQDFLENYIDKYCYEMGENAYHFDVHITQDTGVKVNEYSLTDWYFDAEEYTPGRIARIIRLKLPKLKLQLNFLSTPATLSIVAVKDNEG